MRGRECRAASRCFGCQGGPPIFHGLVDSWWHWFKWALAISVVAGLIAVPYLYQRMDEEIRRRVQGLLAGHYQGLVVEVRSAMLVEGEGIEIRGLSILEPGPDGQPIELLYVDEMFLKCDTALKQLLSTAPRIEHITLRRPRLRLAPRDDGTWNVQRLLPLPRFSERPADITIENGSIECTDPFKSPASLFTLREVHLALVHEEVEAAAGGGMRLRVRGTLTGDHLRRVAVDGALEPDEATAVLAGRIEGLDFSPEFAAALPQQASQPLEPLAALRAQCQVGFRVEHRSTLPDPWRYELAVQITRGRLDDPRLPYPLADLRATIACDNSGLVIKQLTARNGHTRLELSCHRHGYQPDSPLVLQAASRQMVLDERLLGVLPEAWRPLWDKFSPAGEIDVDARVVFDGRVWQPELTVRCLNASFLYYKFPYPLERATGTLELKDDVLAIDLLAHAGADPVRIQGRLVDPGPDWNGEVTIDARTIPLDERLFAALPEKPREVIRSMNARGSARVFYKCWRTPDDAEDEFHKELWGSIQHGSVRFDKFPYPIDNVRGEFSMRDDAWTFRNFEGNHGAGMVTCQGWFDPDEEGGLLALDFTGKAIRLDEELREALDEHGERVWGQLRPRGKIDLPRCHVRYAWQEKRLGIEFRLEPRLEPGSGEAVSIEPSGFPYRLDRLQGALVYRNGEVTIEKLRGEHGPVQLATRGGCSCGPGGDWRLRLDELVVDRLEVDRELLAALPERLRKAAIELKPTGPLYLRGRMVLAQAYPHAPLESEWDLEVELAHGSLEAGLKLEAVRGGVHLQGGFDGQRLGCRGELNIDSLMYKDLQLTEVRGPLWIDDTQVRFGSWAETGDQRQPARNLTAHLYGGTLLANGGVTLGPVPTYALQASVADADLARFAQETFRGRQQMQGKVYGRVELQGVGTGAHKIRGTGGVRLRNADIYELPLMVALLKILSVRPPDTTAFTESDIDFRVDGGHVYFTRIDFNGDAISLRGNGEMNFEQEIDLKFRADVGRSELRVPLLGEMLKGASQQIMLIHVGGTVNAPLPRAEAFPGVNQAFKELEAGLQGKEE